MYSLTPLMLLRLGNKKKSLKKWPHILCISSALFLIGLDTRHSVASRSISVAFLKVGASC